MLWLILYHEGLKYIDAGGNEYGQCGEEPEKKDDSSKPLRRDIVIPQRCAPKLSVRQVCFTYIMMFFWYIIWIFLIYQYCNL